MAENEDKITKKEKAEVKTNEETEITAPSAKTDSAMKQSLVKNILIIIVIGLAIWGVYNLVEYAKNNPRGAAVDKIAAQFSQDEKRKNLAEIIQTNYNEYRNYASNWSLATFGSMFLAAIFTALAGLVLKLSFLEKKDPEDKDELQKDLAAIFAVVGTILIVISTNGDFTRKWQANRAAASGMENLAYDLLKEPFDDKTKEAILTEIKEINSKRNQDIIGEAKSEKKDQDNKSDKQGEITPTPKPTETKPANTQTNTPNTNIPANK